MTVENHPAYRLQDVPEPPESLSEGAKQEWQHLATIVYDLGTARPADIPSLALLCEINADIHSLESAIRSDGYTIEAGSGGRKAHPALQSLTAARRQAQALLDKFGLVPGSKARRVDRFSAHNHAHNYR